MLRIKSYSTVADTCAKALPTLYCEWLHSEQGYKIPTISVGKQGNITTRGITL
jgi:hypothetical protein